MHLLQIHEPGETPAPHEGEGAPSIGIDLGTTHSAAAVSIDGRPVMLRDAHGSALLPSAVHYSGNGKIIVGEAAKKARSEGSLDAVTSIKRLMGRGKEDIAPVLGEMPYAFAEDSGMARLMLGGKPRTPVEISAEILKTLKATADAALDADIRQAVITVPAYFDDAARTATKDAARLAGLEVLRLLNEPTAAALAYGLQSGAEGIYAIYDFGGGTFDISLLKLTQGVFQVLSTGGDTQLGGDDIDHAVAESLAPRTDKRGAALLALARRLKEDLSESHNANVEGVELTREQMDALALPFIEKTLAACAQAMADADLKKEDIQGVVLVGGSTRMPLVRKKVEGFFGKTPLTDMNPDEIVAMGAAIQAEGLTQGSDNLLLDVVPLSLGLETMGGLTEKLIHRNTAIPTEASQEFTTWADGQTGMQIHVLQGEREMVEQNRSLARFELKGIPPLPAGIARVKVTFRVDADGLLTVEAQEERTGERQQVEVKPSYGLPAEEIERMLLESMQHAREDIAARLAREAKVEAERAIQELQSAMAQDGELLNPQERRLIELQIGYLREAAREQDRERIDVEMQQLAQTANPFAERRMNKAIATALTGTHVDKVS